MAKPDSCNQARRRELTTLMASCNRDDYAFSDCPSVSTPLGQSCDAWSKLVACDEKIAQVEAELIHLHRSRILLKENVNRSHDKLLGTIPAEVVTQIFGFYVQLLRKNSEWSVPTILLTLAGVSKAWRDLVFDTPQFWTTFIVNIDHNIRESRVQSLQTWLGRSAWTPLSISLHFRKINRDEPLTPHPLLDMVVGSADRWKHLSLSLKDEHHCEIVIKDQKRPDLRQLESLRIKLDNEEIGPNLKSFLQCMPHLKYFKINYLRSLSGIHLTWSALTHLKIGLILRNLILPVLNAATSLIQCKIGIIDDLFELPQAAKPSFPMIVHSHLQRLHIEDSGFSSSKNSHFDRLVLPSLKDFSYQAIKCASSDVRGLASMITQSNCAIERLSISINNTPSTMDSDIRKIVDASPTLKHLDFHVIFADLGKEESILERLAGGQLHPHLQSLEVTYSGLSKFGFARIADCFDPNGKPGYVAIMHRRPLRYARIRFYWETREKLLEISRGDTHFARLVQVKKSGFDLEILNDRDEDLLQNFENTNLDN